MLLLVVLHALGEVLSVDLVDSLAVLRKRRLAHLACLLFLWIQALVDAFACALVWLFFRSREIKLHRCHQSQSALRFHRYLPHSIAAAAAAVVLKGWGRRESLCLPAHSVVGFWNLMLRPWPALHAPEPGTWQGTRYFNGISKLWVVRPCLQSGQSFLVCLSKCMAARTCTSCSGCRS